MAGWKTMAQLALHLFQAIPKRIIKEHKVAEALVARRWVTDIRGALCPDSYRISPLMGFGGRFLAATECHQHVWRLTRSGSYSSKSAYNAFFLISASALLLGNELGNHGLLFAASSSFGLQ
jgi:hypothetical protein